MLNESENSTGRLGGIGPAFLFAVFPLLRIWPSEAPYGITAAFPQITHQHAPFGGTCLHDLAIANVDADVVYLIPSAAA